MFPSHGKHKNCSGENAEVKGRRRGSLAASRAFSDTYSQAHGRGAPQLHPASAQQHQETKHHQIILPPDNEGFPSPESIPFSIQHSLVSPTETHQQCQRYLHSTDQEQSCSLGHLLGSSQCHLPLQHPQTCRQLHRVTLLIEILTLYL